MEIGNTVTMHLADGSKNVGVVTLTDEDGLVYVESKRKGEVHSSSGWYHPAKTKRGDWYVREVFMMRECKNCGEFYYREGTEVWCLSCVQAQAEADYEALERELRQKYQYYH